jgi:hypothetical protein
MLSAQVAAVAAGCLASLSALAAPPAAQGVDPAVAGSEGG